MSYFENVLNFIGNFGIGTDKMTIIIIYPIVDITPLTVIVWLITISHNYRGRSPY